MKTIVATFDAGTIRRHRFVINEGQPESAGAEFQVGIKMMGNDHEKF